MNVYAFELKREWKSALSWSLVLLVMLFVLMFFVYPIYMDSRGAVESILRGFPMEFSRVFGVSDLARVFSFGGFYCFSYLYISLCGAIMAASLGISTFGREKRAKSTDFLLCKPRSRSDLFFSKALADLTFLAVFNLAYLVLTVCLFQSYAQVTTTTGQVILAVFALFLTQLLFWSVGVLVATLFKKIRSASASAMAIGFGGFVLLALHSLLKEDILRYTAPLGYYSPMAVFDTGSFETPYAITGAALTLLFLLVSYLDYCHADVHAV